MTPVRNRSASPRLLFATAVLATVILATGGLAVSRAGDVGFIEDFALAPDRARALEQLIPGTEDYYFFHCLNDQHEGKLGEVDKLLAAWIERHGRTARVEEIENRQALLRYPEAPRKSLDFLRDRLGLRFDHQREALGEDPKLPTSLDPKAVSRDAFLDQAMRLHPGTTDGFEGRALEWASGLSLDPDRRRHLLGRLIDPDVPNLPKLVVDDVSYKGSGGFGSLGIHARMLQSQLDECLRLKSGLLNESRFVNIYMTKLWPADDVDWRVDAKAREAYLDRLLAFTSRLNGSFNSLKAHVLYHRLAHDRSLGAQDRDRFIAYLKLPRNAPYVSKAQLDRVENRKSVAELGADFKQWTLLPPVGDDEPLVRSYLERFFLADDDFRAFEPYLNDVYLKRVFAETKITAGVGDQEKWYSYLSPQEHQALLERVDLDFAPENKAFFDPDEQVALDVHVKGVKTLIVKVFELNTLNYYRTSGRELGTAIDLDGLVANEERTIEYTEPALRRVKRHFEFPSLAKRGAYVIDFIGGGKSSRALVRKGRLRFLERAGTAGHVFTVIDEGQRKLQGASIWLAGHRYDADKDGLITVPFSTQPAAQPIVLVHDGFASLESFQHAAESYNLTAGFHVEREALISRAKAKVLVRPVLTVNGTRVTLSVLEEPKLVITSTDLDGVSTTREAPGFELREDRESAHELQVPARLARIAFTLQAKVQSPSTGKKVDVAAAAAFEMNGLDPTEKVECVHLLRAEGGYAVDLLGRSGEPRASRPVGVKVKHRDFREPFDFTLATSKAGRVGLGALDGIEWVEASGPEGPPRRWPLREDECSYPSSLHARAGEPILVSYMGPTGAGGRPPRAEVSLIELHGGSTVEDRFDAVSLEGGYLKLAGLSAGDYELRLKRAERRIAVRVAAGASESGYVLTPYRQLEVRGGKPLQIASAAIDGDALKVRLAGATKFTRVHIAATRYEPEYPIQDTLELAPSADLKSIPTDPPESLYIVGRDIGDEYRYILERKQAKKFPGNMLARPSLLLNPWAVQSTETATKEARVGTAMGQAGSGVAGERRGRGSLAKEGGRASGEAVHLADLDFVGEPALVLANLRPDADGIVAVPRKDFGGRQHLHIEAVSPEESVYREVVLAETPLRPKDLRLADGLDPARHFTQKKEVSIALKDAPVTINDITTTDLEVYDTLAKVHSLFVTLSGDANLVEFGFIVNWPKLKPEEKREQYSKHACHELNFFLFRKDPAFFEEVVKPYLRNKYQKTFLDRWLLGDDLTAYLEPWAYGQLNVVEKILLASRVPGEPARTAKHVDDVLETVPPDPQRWEHLFETALRGRSLEASDALGLKGAKEKAGELKALAKAEESLEDAEEARADAKDGAKRQENLARRKLAEAKPRAPAAAGAMPAKNAPAEAPAPEAKAPTLALDELQDKNDAYFEKDVARRSGVRQLYRKLETTQEWAENNYHHLRIEDQNASLITANAFWADFAKHDGRGPFFSKRFPEASRNFAEMMLALAVLDLPFEAGEHGTDASGLRFTLKPASPLLLVRQEISETPAGEEGTPILVTQAFYRHGERYEQVGAERRDKFVADELIAGVVYGAQVVVTNPTSSTQKLTVLFQIPRGSIPVAGSRATDSLQLELEAYHTWTRDFFFYFPTPGSYAHFPVHVAKGEKHVASAKPFVLNVVARPSKVDAASWDHVSQSGTTEEVLAFLAGRSLTGVNLDRIAWRMRERDVFTKVLAALDARHVYVPTLWSYGIFHDAQKAAREFLRHADAFVARCGAAIKSPLLDIDPVERKSYQHLEYWPLVNARAHRLGKERTILNDRFHTQYLRLMNVLAYRPKLDQDDLLSVTVNLLLQDRVDDALSAFDRIRSGDVAAKIEYDYLDSYLAFYRADLRKARQSAERYASYPVERWRNLFGAVLAQAGEVEGKAASGIVDKEDHGQAGTQLAATEPGFEVQVEGGQVKLSYQNLEQVQVSYYVMDLELLFSRSPFVGERSAQFSFVRPSASETVKLDPKKSANAFPVPEKLAAKNVLVEVTAAGITKGAAHLSGALAPQVIENYAQARIAETGTGKALAGVYVKVYARTKDGGVRFYKDGYTDLRGRFDYGSLSTNELDNVSRFALLFLSDEHGAALREASAPKQ